MNYFSRLRHVALAFSLLGIIPTVGFAGKIIYATETHFDEPFGIWGFDIYKGQSAALRFTPTEDGVLNKISFWFMNDDWYGEHHGTVTISLHEDQNINIDQSIPSNVILESWTLQITANGWLPQQENVLSQAKPTLQAGRNYWLSVSSSDEEHKNAVWCVADSSTGYMTSTQQGKTWQPISNDQPGTVATVAIEAE